MDTPDQIIKKAQAVLQTEIEGIEAIKQQLDNNFVELVAACIKTLDNGGKIVITGVGKSGHVGSKMAATLASTGSTAIFMHPVEAMHGDLGMLQENDIMIALSYSGETQELTRMIIPAKRLGVPVACFTGIPESTLAKLSDIVVIGAVEKEACPFNLAPTTTSTAHLALGDALAMVLLQERKFTKEDYGRRHPGGAIGRMVTMKASDVMRKAADSAVVPPDFTVRETLYAMSHARSGAAVVADAQGKVLGIFTDGDFRRSAAQDDAVLTRKMSEVKTPSPISVNTETMVVEVIKLVENRRIDDLVVVDDENKVAGIIDIQDLPGLKIM